MAENRQLTFFPRSNGPSWPNWRKSAQSGNPAGDRKGKGGATRSSIGSNNARVWCCRLSRVAIIMRNKKYSTLNSHHHRLQLLQPGVVHRVEQATELAYSLVRLRWWIGCTEPPSLLRPRAGFANSLARWTRSVFQFSQLLESFFFGGGGGRLDEVPYPGISPVRRRKRQETYPFPGIEPGT